MNSLNQGRFSRNHYTNPLIIKNITNNLITLLPHKQQPILIVCIGTDRSTGDSLGPQIGTYLKKHKPSQLTVLGTLHNPIHALNLEETILYIHTFYHNPFIIAVDAALGSDNSIGNIICKQGVLRPGAAFQKHLPTIGNISFTGVVNSNVSKDYSLLQSTRLSLVYDMANKMSSILYQIDKYLSKYYHDNKIIN